MRHDYVNLLAPFTALKARLDADGRQARCLLGRMSDAGLERIVTGPLRLAGVPSPEASLLARTVRDEVGQRPGDLALVEMALTETWRARGEHGGNLLAAYAAVGRVEGALAKAAEQVRHHLLDDAERALLDPVLIRLVRLGDTGGATRRVASRDELDDARWALLQKLAGEDGRRLVLIGGSDERPTAEIAHEALVTAWPHFQNLLQAIAPDKRTLDTLIPRAKAWAAAQETDRAHHLATGADLDLFAELARARPAWLSGDEAAFVAASAAARSIAEERQRAQALTAQRLAEAEAAQARLQAEQAEAARHAAEGLASERQRRTRAARRGAIAALALALLAAGFGVFSLIQKHLADAATVAAEEQRQLADANARSAAERLARMQMQESLRLANLAEQELSADHPVTAVLLALRGLPVSREHPERAWRAETGQALYDSLWGLGKTEVLQGGFVASFSPDGTHVVTASWDGTARVWRADGSGEPVILRGHGGGVTAASFSPDGTHVVTASLDRTARVWRADGSGEPVILSGHEGGVTAASFSPDGTHVVTASDDRTARVWRADGSGEPVILSGHEGPVAAASFSRDGTHVVTASRDKTARVWRADGSGEPVILSGHGGPVTAASFSPDGTHVVTASRDKTARVWPVLEGWALVDWARRAVRTTLSPEQEQHFYLEKAGATDGGR